MLFHRFHSNFSTDLWRILVKDNYQILMKKCLIRSESKDEILSSDFSMKYRSIVIILQQFGIFDKRHLSLTAAQSLLTKREKER